MAKTITLQNINVKEVLIVPGGAVPLTVLFEAIDASGKPIMHKRVEVSQANLPSQAAAALQTIITKITERLKQIEGI